jgi:hypothetical protein
LKLRDLPVRKSKEDDPGHDVKGGFDPVDSVVQKESIASAGRILVRCGSDCKRRGNEMEKKSTKNSEKNTRSRRVRDLPAKPLAARKATSVKGGMMELVITKKIDKSSASLF